MRALKFPNMFNTNSTNVYTSDKFLEATYQNTELLLESTRGELFGDPYWGTLFKKFLFDQNGRVLKEHIIDLIYTQIALFIPQLKIERHNIDIVQNKKKGQLICRFSAINQIDYTNNMYNLVLFSQEEAM